MFSDHKPGTFTVCWCSSSYPGSIVVKYHSRVAIIKSTLLIVIYTATNNKLGNEKGNK